MMGNVAETAHLITQLDLKDGLTPGLNQAKANVRGFAASAQSHLPRVSGLLSKGGDAARHFAGRVGQLASAITKVGLLGGAAGLAAYTRNAIKSAEEWGRTTDRLKQLTGASTEVTSRFADAYDALGVSQDKQVRIIGMLQKNLGTLHNSKTAARKLEQEYGFEILKSNGRVKDAFTIIDQFTRYFNDKHIPASQKAALGAKLFGRSWQDLLPTLELGPKRIKKAQDDAMTMSDQQVKDLHRWRDAQREFNDTMGDLSVQVGLMVIPSLTKLSRGLNQFVTEHQQDILGFFKGFLRTAEDAAQFVAGTVIPTIGDLANTARTFWDSIPGPLKDLMIKGIVADRAIKFLFGFSITGAVGGAIKDALGGVIGRFFGRGSSPATPMYVAVAGGLPGAGAGGVVGGGGKGLGLLGKAAIGVSIVGMAAAVMDAWNEHIIGTVARNQESNRAAAEGIVGQGMAKSITDLANMSRLLREKQGFDRVVIDTTSAGEIGRALVNASREVLAGSRTGDEIGKGISSLLEAQQQAREHGWTEVADSIGRDIEALRRKTPTAGEIGEAVGKETTGDKGGRQRSRADATRIGEVIRHLRGIGDDPKGRDYGFARAGDRNARQLIRALATTGTRSDRVIRDTIADLKREQVRAQDAGATRLARNLGRDITTLRAALGRKQDTANARLGTIARKDTSVSVTVPVTTSVSVRDVVQKSTTYSRYGYSAV